MLDAPGSGCSVDSPDNSLIESLVLDAPGSGCSVDNPDNSLIESISLFEDLFQRRVRNLGSHLFLWNLDLLMSCTFSILTPVHAQRSSIRALTYTTQVRSSASQVFVGYGNHRAEPDAVLRRAPTLSDEQGQQRVGSRALSPSELWPQGSKERTPGKLRNLTLSGPSSCPRESPTNFPYGETMGKPANAVNGST